MSDRFAFPIGNPHHRTLDREKLVGQPGFVRQIEFTGQAVLVGPEACDVHQTDADQHHERRAQGEAIETPPEAEDGRRPPFTHVSHPLRRCSLRRARS